MATVIDELIIRLELDALQVKHAAAELKRFEDAAKEAAAETAKNFSFAEEASKQLKSELKSLAVAAAGVPVSLALSFGSSVKGAAEDLFAWVSKGTEELDKIAKKSRATGIAVEDLQRLNFAASQAGASGNVLTGAVSKLNKALLDIELQGAKGAAKGLGLLGLSYKDLNKLNTVDRLALVADRLKLIASDGERAAISTRIFGKAGQTLSSLFADGGAGVKEFFDQASVATAADVAISEKLSDSIGLAKNQVKGFSLAILADLTPVTLKYVDAANDWLKANREFIKDKLHDVIKLGTNAIEGLLPLAKEAGSEIANWVTKNAELIKQDLPRHLKEIAETAGKIGRAMSYSAQAARDLATGIEAIATVGTGGRGFADTVRHIQDRPARERAEAAERRKRELAGLGLGEEDIEFNPRDPKFAGLDAAGVSALKAAEQRAKDARDAAIRKAQAKFRHDAAQPKKKKEKEKKSSLSFVELLERSNEAGGFTLEDLKGIKGDAPSTKDVKPTVAIDYFIFQIVQNITSPDAKDAGDASAKAIRSEFQRATVSNVPIGHVVR